MSIVNALFISTAHVSDETVRELDEMCVDNWSDGVNKHGIFSTNFGWFLFVSEENSNQEIQTILDYARSKDCWYVVLDNAGDICNDLPVFG